MSELGLGLKVVSSDNDACLWPGHHGSKRNFF